MSESDSMQNGAKAILVVEDNFLAAQSLQRSVTEMGFEVVGPVARLDQGVELAKDQPLIGAILDINIVGGSSAAIADILDERRCPYFFVTGYASPHLLPDRLQTRRKLNKPIYYEELEAAIRADFNNEPASADSTN